MQFNKINEIITRDLLPSQFPTLVVTPHSSMMPPLPSVFVGGDTQSQHTTSTAYNTASTTVSSSLEYLTQAPRARFVLITARNQPTAVSGAVVKSCSHCGCKCVGAEVHECTVLGCDRSLHYTRYQYQCRRSNVVLLPGLKVVCTKKSYHQYLKEEKTDKNLPIKTYHGTQAG